METTSRNDSLQGLRGIGCLGIIAMHVMLNSKYNLNANIVELVSSWTWFVYLFLIISAYGMCCGYFEKIKNGSISINDFYVRRFKKFWPFYALLVVVAAVFEHTKEAFVEAFLQLFLLQGLLPNNELSNLGVSWTLGVIFLFYMLFPYYVFVLSDKKRALLVFISSIVITSMCDVYFFTEKFVKENFTSRHSLLYCIPVFMTGGLIYLYKSQIIKWVNKYKYVYICLMLGICIVTYFFPDYIYGVNTITIKCIIIFSLWIAYAISCKDIFLNSKVMKYIGDISFEMYLAHMLVYRMIEKMKLQYMFGVEEWGFVLTVLVVVFLLIIFIQLYKSIEMRIGKTSKSK